MDIATDRQAAIRAIGAAPYDLVLMDIFALGMSGNEATQIIRTLPKPAGSTPIIALTASIGPDDEGKFKAAGFDGILQKPVSVPELLDTLDRHVWSAELAAYSTSGIADGNGAFGNIRPTRYRSRRIPGSADLGRRSN